MPRRQRGRPSPIEIDAREQRGRSSMTAIDARRAARGGSSTVIDARRAARPLVSVRGLTMPTPRATSRRSASCSAARGRASRPRSPSRAQVDRAIPLSAELQRAIGVRETNLDPLVEGNDARYVWAQAFTLFATAYNECRRGVSHLRWHEGDATEIVPSLYRGRGGRGTVAKEDVADDLVDVGGADEPEDEPVPVATAADAVVSR